MSIKTVRAGATEHPESMIDFLMSRVIHQSGVHKLAGTNLKVAQQVSPNMTVKIQQGYGFIKKADNSKVYPILIDTSDEDATIGANGSGNTRIDAIVLYIDLSASPNVDASNVAKIKVVAGTPSGSPSAPDDSAIQTDIGASNPYIRLANITVASGASQILTANIADTRIRSSKVKVSEGFVVDTDMATIEIDFEAGGIHQITLEGNRTLVPVNYQEGDIILIKFIQDATGGRSITWWSNIDWADDDSEPVLNGNPAKEDAYIILVKAGGRFQGFIAGEDFPTA